MSPIKPRRPGSIADDTRDRRRSESAGMGIPAPVIEEGTPPPTRIPIAISRTPTPDETREQLAQHARKLNELVDATERMWGARDIDKQLDRIETKLDGWAQTATRNDQMIKDVIWPGLQGNIARADELRERIVAAEQLTDTLRAVALKLDGFTDQLGEIKTEQRLAAERAEAHEATDARIYEAVEQLQADVGELKTARAVADSTAKIRRAANVRPWWFSSKGVVAVAAGIAAAIGTIIAAASGGCS